MARQREAESYSLSHSLPSGKADFLERRLALSSFDRALLLSTHVVLRKVRVA
jgi:hypothetical protein